MDNLFMLLDGETPVEGTQQGGDFMSMLMTFAPIILMVVFFYFFLIRPQKKQEKETAAMRNSLSVGDEVTTIGGIIGRVTHVKDDVVTIETGADRNKIRFRKSAIASVDKKYGESNAPKGGYKVSVKKNDKAEEKVETPIEAPALKEDNKEEK